VPRPGTEKTLGKPPAKKKNTAQPAAEEKKPLPDKP
jgi:hypothetical protein